MKLRIIKEESVYRIQEMVAGNFVIYPDWIYAKKALKTNAVGENPIPIDFKTPKEAEDFIEHNFVVKVVKEYEVE